MAFAKKLTKREDFKTRYAHLCTIYDSFDDVIDEAIVLYFKNPHSFTGEDVVEFQTHGSSLIAEIILGEVIKLGGRLANPGEFSKRAFLNEKIDLSQAEAISKLIDARSKDAIKLLSKQLKGELRSFVDDIRDKLVEILAFIEVNIDYAEEDLPKDLGEQIKHKLFEINSLLKQTLTSSKLREGMIEGFKISIIGKPNVGKSSILNKLLSYDRAIISDIAGTTRDTIEESLRVGTHLVKIVDTAGIRSASDEIEKIGIQRSKKSADESEIILAVFDISEDFSDEDKEILSLIQSYKDTKQVIVVLNKKDKKTDYDKSLFQEFDSIEFSKNDPIDTIVEKIKTILDTTNLSDDMLLTSKRQVGHVEDTYNYIDEAVENLDMDELELFAYNINDAIISISSITKSFERDEILDKMFGSFCLGK